jgi:hypothetical protein
VVTEWPEFAALDWRRVGKLVRRRLVVDGRNLLDEQALADLGFTYVRMGRRPPKGALARGRATAPLTSPAMG